MSMSIFIFAYLSVKLNNEHGILQTFFLTMCLLFVYMNIGVMIELCGNQGVTCIGEMLNPALYGVRVVFYIFLLYLAGRILEITFRQLINLTKKGG